MPAKIICVANRKGGVGKTTVSVLLAQAFKDLMGRAVALVDVDPQASATRALAGEPGEPSQARLQEALQPLMLERLLERRSRFPQSMPAEAIRWGQISALTDKPDTALSLVPCSAALWRLEQRLADAPLRRGRTRNGWNNLLRRLCAEHDYVIIDTPPGRSFFGDEALKCADLVLVPCDVTPVAVSAMRVFLELLRARHRRKPAALIWTKHRDLNDIILRRTELDEALERAGLAPVADLLEGTDEADLRGLRLSPAIAKGIGRTSPGRFESVYGSLGRRFAAALAEAAERRLAETTK